MIVYNGKSASDGIAIGKVYIYEKKKQTVYQNAVENIEQEILRFSWAKEQILQQLKILCQKVLEQAGKAEAGIFEAHRMMLEDEEYIGHVLNLIREQRFNAESAVSETGRIFAGRFAAMDDEYLKERAADINDISEKLIYSLQGMEPAGIKLDEPVIILALDLSPGETVLLDKSKVLAIVTKTGSTFSHAAILARAMNIPVIVDTDINLKDEYNGKTSIVDAFTGRVYINPDEEFLEVMRKRQDEALKQRKALQEFKGKESITASGQKIQLFANISCEGDVDYALENDAEGIGLFRTEFLYIGRKDFPSEDQQFEIFKNVLIKMGGRKVIIRTLDIGADKQAECFNIKEEESRWPRSVRICFDHPHVLKTQLRAILRAAVYGTAAIMFPMIVSLDEVAEIKHILEEARTELRKLNIPFEEPELGVMIETPAAVILSEELAKEVDFFSIGTNDLTRETYAAYKNNTNRQTDDDTCRREILKMIGKTVYNAHKAGIWAGICGELAADLSLTETFLKMGVDELSVSPTFLLPLRKLVRELQ